MDWREDFPGADPRMAQMRADAEANRQANMDSMVNTMSGAVDSIRHPTMGAGSQTTMSLGDAMSGAFSGVGGSLSRMFSGAPTAPGPSMSMPMPQRGGNALAMNIPPAMSPSATPVSGNAGGGSPSLSMAMPPVSQPPANSSPAAVVPNPSDTQAPTPAPAVSRQQGAGQNTQVSPAGQWQGKDYFDLGHSDLEFGPAFRKARQALGPDAIFMWRGKLYTTKMSDEG